MNSWPKVKLGSHYVPLFGFIYSYFAPIHVYHFGPDLALFSYIFQYLALFTYIYPYLVIFTINFPNYASWSISSPRSCIQEIKKSYQNGFEKIGKK